MDYSNAKLDEAFSSLFCITDRILEFSERNTNILENSKNTVRKFYNGYKRSYRPDSRRIHVDILRDFFEKKSFDIFKNVEDKSDDEWLFNKDVSLVFGKMKRKLPVLKASEIYKISIENSDIAEKLIDDQMVMETNPEKSKVLRKKLEEEYPQIYHPDTFMLRFYQLLSVVVIDPDYKRMINDRIVYFKGVLGMNSGKNNAMSGLMNMFSTVLGSTGIKDAEGNTPDPNKMMDSAKGFIQSEDTQKVFGNIMGKFQNCDNIEDAISNISKVFADPEVKNTVGSFMEKNGFSDVISKDVLGNTSEDTPSDSEEDGKDLLENTLD